jgi:hypothetical protein
MFTANLVAHIRNRSFFNEEMNDFGGFFTWQHAPVM